MVMLYKRGHVFWIKYYVNGRPVRESAGTDRETQARKLLKDREGRVEAGLLLLPRVARVRVEELLTDLRAHYETTGQRNLREADTRLIPLRSYFSGRLASAVTGALITEYVQRRQAATVANGTINRELSVLGTAFRLGEEHGKVARVPILHLLKEATPRQGFFDEADFRAVRGHLPPDLGVAVTIMYTFGWRLSEVMGLRLSQVDLEIGTMRLEPGTTKNREGRVVYLTPELSRLIREQIDRVLTVSRTRGQLLPWLFTHLAGCYAGTPRRDFRKAWADAVAHAGLAGKLKHDFRRTAVRNMERNGVARSVAMKLTGTKRNRCIGGMRLSPMPTCRRPPGSSRAQFRAQRARWRLTVCAKSAKLGPKLA